MGILGEVRPMNVEKRHHISISKQICDTSPQTPISNIHGDFPFNLQLETEC